MGIYAPTKSKIVNHVGEGNIKTLAIPPNRKKTPIPRANFILWLTAINPAIKAPTNVPRAWAKNGIIKCFGPNKCIDADKPSIVVTSAPSGGGMIEPLIIIIPMFTALPKTIPAMTAKIFLTIGLIFVFCYLQLHLWKSGLRILLDSFSK